MANLVSNEEWNDYIKKLENIRVGPAKEDYIKLLEKKLLESINKRKKKLKNFGILFSGGIDSSLIALLCKKLKLNFFCYTVGLENSEDLEYAKKIADSIDINLKTRIIRLNEVEDILKKSIKITKKKDVVNVGVGFVVYSGLESAKKNNIKTVLTGMGADELFAGYARFEKTKSVKKECILSIKNIYNDMERDFLIADNFNVEIVAPFLDVDVISLAMRIPPDCKIKNKIRKYILRKIALDLGLKKEFAFRNKKAAQYGSKIDRAISKLAKKNGFKFKKDYLESLS